LWTRQDFYTIQNPSYVNIFFKGEIDHSTFEHFADTRVSDKDEKTGALDTNRSRSRD
jgi:hypothetical protein